MVDSKNHIRKQIKNAIEAVDPTAEVILYGSQARGDAHEDSDWDILVLADKPIECLRDQEPYRNAIFSVMLENDELISTIIRNKTTWKEKHFKAPLFHEISKEGIRL
jgi:predicted nucleotidyltransferase